MLDSVKGRLTLKEKFNEVCDTNAILKEIKEVCIDYSRAGWLTPAHDISVTGWIFTYIAIKENKPKLRLATVHPADAKEIALIQENKLAAIWPSEATRDQANVMGEILEKKIKPMQEISSINDSIQYHTVLIANLIREIQPLFSSISAYFQIGVHTLDGFTGISEIIKDNEPFSLT